jgi:hypothetical protein
MSHRSAAFIQDFPGPKENRSRSAAGARIGMLDFLIDEVETCAVPNHFPVSVRTQERERISSMISLP